MECELYLNNNNNKESYRDLLKQYWHLGSTIRDSDLAVLQQDLSDFTNTSGNPKGLPDLRTTVLS